VWRIIAQIPGENSLLCRRNIQVFIPSSVPRITTFNMSSMRNLTTPMEKDILEIGKKLSLTEEDDDDIVLPELVWVSAKNDNKLTLIGRILTHRSVNFEALRSTLSNIIRPNRGMTISRINDERLGFKFNHKVDMQHALDGGPWTFDRNLLILQPMEDTDDPGGINLDWCPFVVHIHDIPINLRTDQVFISVGNKICQYVEVLSKEGNLTWNSSVRVRININVNKALKQQIRIRLDISAEVTLRLTYERLPNFCYICGRIGHISKFCELHYSEGFVDPGPDYPFGPWLRENGPLRNQLM
ncbi:UNVERIFIED_CONTAM: hypothetical protein Slati_3872300, partial [Sesamum latifolium]